MPDGIKFEVIKKISETNFKYKDLNQISKIDGSSPPSVFIGSKLKYPLVNVGILSPLERDENAWIYDDAKYWANNNFNINEVVQMRKSLINSRFQTKVEDVKSNNQKFLQMAQDIAISCKPVDIEVEFKNNPLSLDGKKDKVLMPQGMSAQIKNAKIIGNVKINRKLDKVMNDDIKSTEGIKILYKNNFDEYILSKILSVGVLGLKNNKKLVPTRWSITAVDDTLGKKIIEDIKEYKWIENHELFFGEYLGNCYLIMLFPNVFSYELFELYLPGSSWNPGNEIKASTDFESFYGRKEYASNTAGGYYATRLPILEYLNRIKRQAAALVIRIETPSYWAALGVWVVRESVKKALGKGQLKFSDMNELIESAKKIGMIKFGFDNSKIIKKSKLIDQIKTQRSLNEWI